MPEIILHYIWAKGLFQSYPQRTTDGTTVEVMHSGRLNHDAGPDFTDVHLRIRGIEMVGQVEIHVNSSDWYKHRHNQDKAYDSILLHVVRHADKEVLNTRGERIMQLELQYDTDQDYVRQMMEDEQQATYSIQWTPRRCGALLMQHPNLITDGWKETMLRMRLECKKESIERLLHVSINDWNQAFYISLAHAFGFHTNGVPMEMLAIATPLSVLRKHIDRVDQLDAILLGQAGLLKEDDKEYEEYLFLQHKFGLKPMDSALWKHGRMRPSSFPEVRIRQMVRLIAGTEFLFSRCMEAANIDELRDLLSPSGMGKTSEDSLIINVVAPFLYAQGQDIKALALLHALPPEDNRIIRQWRDLGQQVKHAADTQALLHLYMTCCEAGQCMSCSVWSEQK